MVQHYLQIKFAVKILSLVETLYGAIVSTMTVLQHRSQPLGICKELALINFVAKYLATLSILLIKHAQVFLPRNILNISMASQTKILPIDPKSIHCRCPWPTLLIERLKICFVFNYLLLLSSTWSACKVIQRKSE